MITLDSPVFYKDLCTAFNSLQLYYTKKYHHNYSGNDLKAAIKELSDNFISADKVGEDILVTFHNPSINDFLESTVRENKILLRDLVSAIEFPDQLLHLKDLVSYSQHNSVDLKIITSTMLQKLYSTFSSPTMRTIRFVNENKELIKWVHWTFSEEYRLLWAVDIWNLTKDTETLPILNAIKQRILERIKCHCSLLGDFSRVMDYIKEGKIPSESLEGELFCSIGHELLNRVKPVEAQIDDFSALSKFITLTPSPLSADLRKQIKNDFMEFCEEEMDCISQQDHDPDRMLDSLDELEMLTKEFNVDVSEKIQGMREDAYELQSPQEDEGERPINFGNKNYDSSENEIDLMFQSLENKKGK